MASRSFHMAAAVAEGNEILTVVVQGAFLRAESDSFYRQTIRQPPQCDGMHAAPGKTCVLQRALNGAPSTNAQSEHHRKDKIKSSSRTQVLSEPFMFMLRVVGGTVRTEFNTDYFFITEPDHKVLDAMWYPSIKEWQVTIRRLTNNTPICININDLDITHDTPDAEDDTYQPAATSVLASRIEDRETTLQRHQEIQSKGHYLPSRQILSHMCE